jgi:sugar lactone lactonase YvrE
VLTLSFATPANAAENRLHAIWDRDLQRAKEAHNRKDDRGYREALLQFHRDFPGNSHLIHDLALSEAKLRNDAGSIKWLQSYTQRGLIPRLEDPAFAGLQTKGKLAVLSQAMKKNSTSIGGAEVLFRFVDPELLVEDIAYDQESGNFLFSSVHQRKILECTPAGKCEDFLAPGDAVAKSLWAVLAIHVDSPHGVLWATTASLEAEVHHQKGDEGRSALLKFDLRTHKLMNRYEAPSGKAHAMGDMTVASNGDVFVSDGLSGDLFAVFHERGALERVVPEGSFISPQTPALSEDEKSLFVPDYSAGIALIRLSDRRLSWVHTRVRAAVDGIDGLYYYKNNLIAVQNGTRPERVVAFHLNRVNQIDNWRVLEANSLGLGDPTHGVLVNSDFYFIANSGWDRVRDDGTLGPGTAAEIRKPHLRGLVSP